LFGLLLLWLLSAPTLALAEGQTARVAFMRGEVAALNEVSGERRTLERNSRVEPGEVIETGPKALAQIVFPDRSMLYVKAASRVKLEQFRFDGGEEDGAVTEILKGGMRSITGLVGKAKPEQVKYKANNTTIGIRGTALEIRQSRDAWLVTFDFGSGFVATQGLCPPLASGDSALFANPLDACDPLEVVRPPNDPSVLARRLVSAEHADTAPIARSLARDLADEDALFVLGLVSEVPGYAPTALRGTVEGFSARYKTERMTPLLTGAALLHPNDTPGMLEAAVRGGIAVDAALEALMRGMERPDPALLERLIRRAVALGLSREQAERILKALRAQGICT
jgi:hypothetical protein